MSFDCASYCHDHSFLSALLRYNLIKGPHAAVESPKESLIDCFASVSTREDVAEKVNRLFQSDNRISRQAQLNYTAGIELEYGKQAKLLNESSCPNVALISALSCLFKLEVYVVCANSPLRRLRKRGMRENQTH